MVVIVPSPSQNQTFCEDLRMIFALPRSGVTWPWDLSAFSVPACAIHILRKIETLCRGNGQIIGPLPGSHFCFNHWVYGQKPFTSSLSGFSDWKQSVEQRSLNLGSHTEMPCPLDLCRHIQGVELELREACKKNYWHKPFAAHIPDLSACLRKLVLETG